MTETRSTDHSRALFYHAARGNNKKGTHMIIAYLTGSLITFLMLLETWHDWKIDRSGKRAQRRSDTRNAAIEYSNVSRKEVAG